MDKKYKGFSKLPEAVQEKMDPEKAAMYYEGGKIGCVARQVKGFGKARTIKKNMGGKLTERKKPKTRTITVDNPYDTSLYDTPQKDDSYKPTKTKTVKVGRKTKRPLKTTRKKRFLGRP
jgi:hypothetical protein